MEYKELESEHLDLFEDIQKVYDLKDRTKFFSYACFKVCEGLPNNYYGRHLKDQLFRCSSSSAANYRAASCAQSKLSFIAKLSIVIEEVDESIYWLNYIIDHNLMEEVSKIAEVRNEAIELNAIFNASRKTAKNSLNKSAK